MIDQSHLSGVSARKNRSKADHRLKIVVTGFGAFPGAPFNPSQAIAQALYRQSRARLSRAGIDLEIAILPVVFAAIPAHLQAIKINHNPDQILHLGLAARRSKITVETRALNRLSILHCDAEGARAQSPQIDKHAPPLRRVPLSCSSIKQAMSGTGVRISLSQDAGDYICNQTLFLSLHLFPQAGFIHLPKPLRPDRKKGPLPARAPRLNTMTQAVERAILCLARPSAGRTILV
jgi:pyroglutamyl-peptidase